jgi:predicted phage-related endonuclease
MIQRLRPVDRRTFIGGSDARTIMGADEPTLLQLWREKRGQLEPEDLSGNLIVQLGLVTDQLNRPSASLVWRPCYRGPCRGSATWQW